VDPIRNPFAPGAGTPPPDLAGREDIKENVRIALERIKLGRSAKSVLMVGLRGVGKTVLLDSIRLAAERDGFHTVRIEAPEGRSLPAMLCPQLRQALLKLSRMESANETARKGLAALAGFAKGLKLAYADIEVGFDVEPEPGLADNGDLEQDLQTLLLTAGHAAAKASSALVMFIDELQYVPEEQLAALIVGLHRAAQERWFWWGRACPSCGDRWAGPSRTPNGCSVFRKSVRYCRRMPWRPSCIPFTTPRRTLNRPRAS
jgi:hypothetical protein